MRCFTTAGILSTWVVTTQAIQPGAAPALPAPLRDLDFGDLNFLHTTDTHGWHAGHLLEPSFSADWGDYISFSEHLREQLEAEGKDLLIIDTGDRIEGNGLYDASRPRGEYTFGIFTQQHIDLLCTGNHELYKNSSADDDYLKLVPAYGENYLASNLDIVNSNTGDVVSLGHRYRRFTTKYGIRIMAFGFIFDFTRNDKNTVITPVELAVKQSWFLEALKAADVDIFVVIGHVALRSHEFEVIHQAIRKIRPDTPIQFFGGHFHTRDYRIFDDKAHALASGRFMETIGFQSISNIRPSADSMERTTFSRRYIDSNLFNFYHHSNKTSSTFHTSAGLYTTRKIERARKALDLDQTYGCAPQTYWMSQAPYPAADSIFSLIADRIFPSIIKKDRLDKSRMIITNTGAIRFDIFAGPFTRDSTYIVSPFTSNLSFITDVPYRLARHLLPILNGGAPQATEALSAITFNKRWKYDILPLAPPQQQAVNHAKSRGETTRRKAIDHRTLSERNDAILEAEAAAHIVGQEKYYAEGDHNTRPQTLEERLKSLQELVDQGHLSEQVLHLESLRQQSLAPHDQKNSGALNPSIALTEDKDKDKIKPIPGYTTFDDLGSDGDDTIHTPIQFFEVPNCIQTILPAPNSSIPLNDTTTSSPPYDSRFNTNTNTAADDELVDLIFNQFLTPYILSILNLLPYLDTGNTGVTLGDDEDYMNAMLWGMADHIPECVTMGLCEDRKPPGTILRQATASSGTEGTVLEADAEESAAELAGGEQGKASRRKYMEKDVENYVPGETFTTLLAKWVAENWKDNCGKDMKLEL